MQNLSIYQSYKKSPYRSIKHSTYFDVYEHIFSPYKNKNIVFVEIGVLGGGSLFMWRDFFGPEARIIGVDLNPEALRWQEHGFEIYIGDQSNEDFWREFIAKVGNVDLVLDDGGHTYEQQIITTESLLPHINNGGLLVVEDTHSSYMPGFGPFKYSFVEYSKKMIDKINFRFSKFTKLKSESRIWGIRFFESFVIFEINKNAVNVKSHEIDNGGEKTYPGDFRYAANNCIAKTKDKLTARKGLIYRNPLFRPLIKQALKFMIALNNRLRLKNFRRYFP